MTERQKETEKDRERQKNIKRKRRQKVRKTDRQKVRQTERQTDILSQSILQLSALLTESYLFN